MRIVELAYLVSRHIALLKAQHRSGVNPTYGQIDDLFEFGAQLEAAADVCAASELPTAACAMRGCALQATTHIGDKRYCQACAARLQTLLAQLRAVGPEVAAGLMRVDWPPSSGERSSS